MARLYLDVSIYQATPSGIWMSCRAGATEVPDFYEADFDMFFEGSPSSDTIKTTLLAMSIAAIAAATGVTLSSETALIAGLPVGV